MALRAVILDFDGTLVESVGIKDEAFRALYAEEAPERLDEIMAYHTSRNATLRFEKFRHIDEAILGRPHTAETAARLAARFSDLVFGRICAAPAVAGIDALMRACEGLPMHLVSMSPDGELARILAARGLDRRLAGVYGGSWRKAEAIADALAREGAARAEAVFVGDTDEDRLAAEEAGVAFVGRDSGRPIGGRWPVHPDHAGVAREIAALRAARGRGTGGTGTCLTT
jgi:phosphoglycolate phosphatase-like HAD superfamily hydrolase